MIKSVWMAVMALCLCAVVSVKVSAEPAAQAKAEKADAKKAEGKKASPKKGDVKKGDGVDASGVAAGTAPAVKGGSGDSCAPGATSHCSPSKEKCQKWKDTYFNVSEDNAAYCMKHYDIKVNSTK